MPANYVLNPRESRALDSPIRKIQVAVGSVIVTAPDGSPIGLQAGEAREFSPPRADLVAYAPKSARISVTYGDDRVPDEPAPKPRPRPKAKAAPKKPGKAKAKKPAPKKRKSLFGRTKKG